MTTNKFFIFQVICCGLQKKEINISLKFYNKFLFCDKFFKNCNDAEYLLIF